MRSYLSYLYGNGSVKEQLGHSAEKDTLSHAFIIEGAPGSGKKTLAKELIAAALCESREDPAFPLPCHNCRACRLINEQKAADVKWISRAEKATLGVDAVRAERNDMYLAPNEFSRKFYVFEDAHTMTVQAQNALLIALEEPPRNVHILLLCESADALLTTVRSRARLIKMQKFPKDALKLWLRENTPSALFPYKDKPKELEAILTEADGCIGRALSLLDTQRKDELFKERELTDLVIGTLGTHSFAKLSSVFSLFPSKRDELIESLSSLLRAMRDVILLKRDTGAPLCYFSSPEEVPKSCLLIKMPTLLSIYESVEDAIRKLERNANSATVLNLLKYTLKKG